MSGAGTGRPEAVVTALAEAMNAHDIDAFVDLFAPDYDSRQPAHPDRAFRGRDQVRANWSAVFAGVPDFHAELIATAAMGDTAWSEWRWRGSHADGSRLDMAGVIVMGVAAQRIAWARLYVEPVEQDGEGITAAVRHMSGERSAGEGLDAFLEARRSAGQDVTVTEVRLAGHDAPGVAHAVSFVDGDGCAVTVLIVGDQAGLAVRDGANACPRWTEHDVSDPGVTL